MKTAEGIRANKCDIEMMISRLTSKKHLVEVMG